MKILLLYQRAHEESLRHYLGTQPDNENELVILEVDSHVKPSLLRENIVTKKFEDYISDEELLSMDQDVLSFCSSWYKFDGRDCTLYDRVSLGELMEFDFMVYFSTVLAGVTYAFRAISTEKPQLLLLFSDQSLLRKIFTFVVEAYFFEVAVEHLSSFGRHIDFIERDKPEIFEHENHGTGPSQHALRKKLLRICSRFWQRLCIESDCIFQRLRPSPRLRTILVQEHRHGRRANLIQQLQQSGTYRVLTSVKYRKSDYKNIARQQRGVQHDLTEIWRQLAKDKQFQRFFTYDALKPGSHASNNQTSSRKVKGESEINLWNFVETHFHKLFTVYFPARITDMELFRRWADREGLSLVLIENPYGSTIFRIWVLISRQLHIPTIGMLEGPFRQVASNSAKYITPITDSIFCWGETGKQMAISQGFKEEDIYIAGEHYLNLYQDTIEQIDSNALKIDLKIPHEKPVILFTATAGIFWSVIPINSMLDREDILIAMCETCRQLENCHFILKFHPSTDLFEGPGSLEHKIGIIQSFHLKNVTIIGSREYLARFIAIADIIINTGSTSGVEAVYFHKPLIFFNLNGRRDLSTDFVSSKAAIGVYRRGDLAPTITQILTDPHLQETLRQGRDTFLKEHLQENPLAVQTIQTFLGKIGTTHA